MTRPTRTQATGPAHSRILGLGGVRGERTVPNDELVDWKWADRAALEQLESPLNVRQFGYAALDAVVAPTS